MLVKMRLSIVVVFSSLMGYFIASGGDATFAKGILLAFGGLLVTFAANALNQVLEKDFDILMTRTADRPVATGRMKSSEAVMFSGLACLVGISILALFNPVTALLGMISLIIYAFVYTPLKRYSTLAVAVGAIPGALPVMIGFAAHDATITYMALSIFIIQFLWQFPHFWSIGFLGFDDYNRAGYKLLPVRDERIDRNLGLSSMFYALLSLPVAVFMFMYLNVSFTSTIIVCIAGLIYMLFSYQLHKHFDRPSAMKLMFYSFLYLPIVLLTYLLF
ncbi:MAG: protoheme IX farnesyltransferase [Saprospiraceae bacterium]|nr:protoheme IX farnesyltransferase [Saprospiraceae bacterium]